MIPSVSLHNVKIVKIPKRLKDKPDKLPWPRLSDDKDKIPMGVDVVAKQPDIKKLVHKFFKVESYQMEELLQEVYVAIIHKNQTRSAHDPRKSSFGHYIYMVANNVCINIVNRKRRYDKESESLDSPVSSTDCRMLLDTIEDPTQQTDGDKDTENTREIEFLLRKHGCWDSARYIRTASTGAKPEIIREALTFGDRKVTNKTIRDYRSQLKDDLSLVMSN